jgi:hypothetical protein
MTLRKRLTGLLIAAATLGFAGPAAAADKDAREVSAYSLSESGLAKFTQATHNLAAVPGACKSADDDDDSNSQTIDQMVAKLNGTAGVQAAIQGAGMTTREYVVFMFSMMQNGMAAWALKQPGGRLPPGTSQANVDFFNKHETAMAEVGKNDPCGDDSTDEEEDENAER